MKLVMLMSPLERKSLRVITDGTELASSIPNYGDMVLMPDGTGHLHVYINRLAEATSKVDKSLKLGEIESYPIAIDKDL